jgi:hypothetical protein
MQTETLDYYWNLAKKIIATHGHKGLLRDDANVGFVAGELMLADTRYNPTIGTKEGYRSMYGQYAVMDIINKKKKITAKTPTTYNIDDEKTDIEYLDKSHTIIDCDEVIDFIRENEIVPEPILEQIKDRYLSRHSYRTISKKFGIPKEEVKLNIRNGLSKIRKVLL